MGEPIFIVSCERIRRTLTYHVRFPINDQLIQRIKELPEETRKWRVLERAWEIHASSLLILIRRYRGSNKIRFDFGSDESRKIFVQQIKKIELAEAEKRKFIAELNVKKENWVRFKNELEKNYEQYSDKLHALLDGDVKLYPHQIVASMFMNVTRSTLISHEMGLGKTLSAILFVEMNGFEKVVVITPNSLKFNFYEEVKKFTNSNAYIVNWRRNTCTIEDAKYVIVNYDFFNPNIKSKRFDPKWQKLDIGRIDSIICDECFPYDTLIQTNIGELKIGDIIENKLDVKVLSYNHKLKKIEYNAINRYLYRGNNDVIKVKLLNGEIIVCTPEHKFYSVDRDKYIPIKDFNYGERLYKYEKKENTNEDFDMSTMWDEIQAKKKFTKTMFEKVFSNFYIKRNSIKSSRNKKIEWEHITDCDEELSILQKRILCSGKKNTKVLLNELLCEMEDVENGNKGEDIFQGSWEKNFGGVNKELQKQTGIENPVIRTYEIEQSNVQTNERRENEEEKREIYFSFKRWKWTINNATNKIIHGIIGNNSNENGISNSCVITAQRNECKHNFTTNTLQSGYRDTEHKIGNRGRWENTQNKEMEISGQEKDRNLEIIGVESVEVLELGDRRKFGNGGCQNKKTYDLEIANNHNFFANGILVSNCQKLKNTKSNTYKNFKRTFNKNIFKADKISKIFLSGTPAPNRAHELYTVLNQVSPLDFATKTYFQKYYCGMDYDHESGWGYRTNSAEQRLEELFHKTAPYTHRKRKIDALKDLPLKTYQKVMMEMDDAEYSTYDDIENNVANEFVERPSGNHLTIMIRLRQYTAHLKVKPLLELIENILETGEKVVIVDYYKESLYELKEALGDVAELHTGDEKDLEVRAGIIKRFQDPDSDLKVFLGTIQTSNYGLTLTAASKLFIITLPYSVGEYDQVADRLHRIGQKAAVNIYPLVFRDTIDDYVFSAIEGKRKEIVKVMDNEDYESVVAESVFSEVVNKIKEKHGKTKE